MNGGGQEAAGRYIYHARKTAQQAHENNQRHQRYYTEIQKDRV